MAFTCPVCQRTSHHPDDERHGYCGACNDFTRDARASRWRIGRNVGRTIYVQYGDAPSKDDRLIGVMDSRDLAARVVDAVNAHHDAGQVADQLDALAEANEWPRIVIGGVGDAYRRAARLVRGADQ